MPTTSNFGWTTPADTDLVKDGAAAIRTLGNGIDTSLLDLKGGTSGQILSKNSNTDLDYTWVTPNVGDITEVQAGVGISVASGTGPIPIITNSSTDLITTAGDLLYGTAADTVARLGIGTAGQVLKVNSGATAPEWGAAGGGLKSYTLINAGGTALTGAATVTVSGISNQQALFIAISNASSVNASATISFRINTDTGNNYSYFGTEWSTTGVSRDEALNTNLIPIALMSNNAASQASGFVHLFGTNSTSGVTSFISSGMANTGGGTGNKGYGYGGFYTLSAAVTSISIVSSTGNLDNGTVYVYGMAA